MVHSVRTCLENVWNWANGQGEEEGEEEGGGHSRREETKRVLVELAGPGGCQAVIGNSSSRDRAGRIRVGISNFFVNSENVGIRIWQKNA